MARMVFTALAGFVLEVKTILADDHPGEAIGLGLLFLVALEVTFRRFSDPEPPAA